MDMIELDGGHGGGQLLRSALTLSLCTGTGFTLHNIRAIRRKPGLMRQHLTAVNAAARVGNACVHGAELGATSLRFEPGRVSAGTYHFATGSAGSATLGPSQLRLEGGTHNPLAPSADFIAQSYLPALGRMGVQASMQLLQHGFHPAGGGVMEVQVQPCAALQPPSLEVRAPLQAIEAQVLMSGLSSGIGLRELQVLAETLGVDPHPRNVQSIRPALGPGNVALVRVRHGDHVEVFSGHGERSVSAEQVGARLAGQVKQYLDGTGAVGEYLSDQLLLPMALAGGGAFTTHVLSDHLVSNARLIEKFLPVEFDWQPHDGGWRVTVQA